MRERSFQFDRSGKLSVGRHDLYLIRDTGLQMTHRGKTSTHWGKDGNEKGRYRIDLHVGRYQIRYDRSSKVVIFTVPETVRIERLF